MNLPSLKKIKSTLHWLDDKEAKLVRKVLEARELKDLRSLEIAAVEDRIGECYHMPSLVDIKLHALNAITHGFGVEYCGDKNDDYDEVRGLDYVNQGDTYNSTIIFDYSRRRWLVCCLGDIIERRMGDYV